MEMTRKQKIELLKAIQLGFITIEEVGKLSIGFIKLPDGKFKREADGQIYTKEEIWLLKSKTPAIKMVLEDEERLSLCLFTFYQLMIEATAGE